MKARLFVLVLLAAVLAFSWYVFGDHVTHALLAGTRRERISLFLAVAYMAPGAFFAWLWMRRIFTRPSSHPMK